MIDVQRLTLLDNLGYALDEIKQKVTPDIWDAFNRWFGNRPPYISITGKKCIHASDLQLYIRLRTNALKEKGITK